MIPVELTQLELELARFVAEQRNRDGQSASADAEKYGYRGSTLELHYQGCLGEMAFAKAMNLYWSGAGLSYHFDDDVGRIQVRVTKYATGCLIVRPNEKAGEEPWVLVTGQDASYRVVGWIPGREAKQEMWLRDPAGRPPAYFVPQDALSSPETFVLFADLEQAA